MARRRLSSLKSWPTRSANLASGWYRLSHQQLERVRPLIVTKAGYAPQHAERLERPRCENRAAVERLPSELPDDAGNFGLRRRVISAQKHGRRTGFVVGIHHIRAA